MDNFLEKFTLYDFFGYAIPGTIVSLLLGREFLREIHQNGILEKYTIYVAIIIIIIGYCVGVAASVIIELICDIFKKIVQQAKGNKQSSGSELKIFKNGELEEIGYEAIKRALKKAKIIKNLGRIKKNEDVVKYIGYMYGEVQVNPKYKRVHNYSAMQLFCSNMVAVGIVISYVFAVEKQFNYCLTGFIIALIFALRADFFYKRKIFYAIAWFTESKK